MAFENKGKNEKSHWKNYKLEKAVEIYLSLNLYFKSSAKIYKKNSNASLSVTFFVWKKIKLGLQ